MSSIKSSMPLEKRQETSRKLLDKHQYPVIVEMETKTRESFVEGPMKFAVSEKDTMAKLMMKYRDQLQKRLNERTTNGEKVSILNENEALHFFLPGNVMALPSATFDIIYQKYKDPEDGFLYITVAKENTFGMKVVIF